MLRKQLFAVLAVVSVFLTSGNNAGAAASSPWVPLVAEYPARVEAVFASLNLDYPGLEQVKASVAKGDSAAALAALRAYYRVSPPARSVRATPLAAIKDNASLQAQLRDSFTFQSVTRTVPRDAQGRLNWSWVPTDTSNQFTHFLNRFGFLNYGVRAAHSLGEPHGTWVNQQLADWVLANPFPFAAQTEPDPEYIRKTFFTSGPPKDIALAYAWYGLNTGIRLNFWVDGFFQMIEHDLIAPRTFLLLLSSLPEQAQMLYLNGGFDATNHTTTEMDALLGFTNAMPEFKMASTWARAATERYLVNYRQAIQPDGSNCELATMYEFIVLESTTGFVRKLKEGKRPVPAILHELLARQANYLAFARLPDGRVLPSGDSDPSWNSNTKGAPIARTLGHAEALYLFTEGKEGTAPAGPPSRFFDWAGNLLSRDRMAAPRQFSWFDIGPYGNGHNHADKLALVVYHGRRLLEDPGRFTYTMEGGWYADYAAHTRGHNTLSVDGASQSIYPAYREQWANAANLIKYSLLLDQPIAPSAYRVAAESDFACGRTTVPFHTRFRDGTPIPGQAVHERAVHYQRGQFWVVVDRVFSDQPRTLDTFWHFHPQVSAIAVDADGTLRTLDPGVGNLMIVPLTGNVALNARLAKGETKPHIQGWYSESYNKWVPSTTAIYHGASERGVAQFGWLIVPYDGANAPAAQARLVGIDARNLATVEVRIGSNPAQVVALPLGEVPAFARAP